VAAGHTRFDPVVDADIVKLKSRTVEVVIERWIASRLEVLLKRSIDSLEVVCSLVAGIILTEEVIRLRRMLRLGADKIVNAKLETFRKTKNRFVS
jgi:hypothetical protein